MPLNDFSIVFVRWDSSANVVDGQLGLDFRREKGFCLLNFSKPSSGIYFSSNSMGKSGKATWA
jgi:hypothetical protein